MSNFGNTTSHQQIVTMTTHRTLCVGICLQVLTESVAFAYAEPSVWKRLPASLRGQDLTLSAFKRDLKTILFDLTS